MADLLQMPKSIRKKEEEEVAAYTARWLELADAALSATEKAAKALEIAREEQEISAITSNADSTNTRRPEAAELSGSDRLPPLGTPKSPKRMLPRTENPLAFPRL